MKAEDLEVIVKMVVAEFNKEFFYNSNDVEDQEIMLENLEKSERYVSFAINRFMENFNNIAAQLSATNIIITQDNTGETND